MIEMVCIAHKMPAEVRGFKKAPAAKLCFALNFKQSFKFNLPPATSACYKKYCFYKNKEKPATSACLKTLLLKLKFL